MVIGDLHTLVLAYVRGEGIVAAARAAGMSRTTAWTRLKSPEAQQMIKELKDEMRAGFEDWPLRVRAVGDMVLDSIVTVLDGDPDPVIVTRLAGIILPELRYLLADTNQLTEVAPRSSDAKETLRLKLSAMETRARATLDAKGELRQLLGLDQPSGPETGGAQ